jgi:hypothetical protein
MNIKHGLLLFVVFLYGCLPSLQSLYTDDTIVFDEALLGKWYAEDDGSWSFTKAGKKGYNLRIIEDNGKEAEFEVHLVQVGGHRFIDLYPGDNIDLENTADTYSFNLIPAHTFMKLDLSEPNLLLQWVNFGDLIKKTPEVLKHEKYDDRSILITATSEDIQRALIENLDEVLVGDAFAMRKCPVDFSQVDTLFDMKLLGEWESDEGDYLDIIALDNGYDILFSDSQSQQTLKGILYNLNNRPVLGLYYVTDASKKSQLQMDLPPDVLVQIECDEHQLKTRTIEWDEIETFVKDNSKYSFDNSEPDDVFIRIAER